ncbi:hypothetical protein DWW96_04095 [Eubacterium sp. AF17-7]|jgi:hypothetical protein|uniref:hypothetical protein n=1 Tax=Eubacterium sp. AF17-7 TaxID=2293105 RepID=UPI000E5172E6|nr:hypothetical protein [Eubacterium sp. AF17-7]RGG66568.1 hypothetical protein DWW96_04095 [Eubacterium sp. AF17-7]
MVVVMQYKDCLRKVKSKITVKANKKIKKLINKALKEANHKKKLRQTRLKKIIFLVLRIFNNQLSVGVFFLNSI